MTDNKWVIPGTAAKVFGSASFQKSDYGLRTVEGGCVVVLFHDKSEASRKLAQVFLAAAEMVPGAPVFATLNLDENRDISMQLLNLQTQNGPERWYSLAKQPFILAFQATRPVAIYNRNQTANDIANWALVSACDSGVHDYGITPAAPVASSPAKMVPVTSKAAVPQTPGIVSAATGIRPA